MGTEERRTLKEEKTYKRMKPTSEKKDMGLSEKVDMLVDIFEDKKKKKLFKLPATLSKGVKGKIKKNHVLVFFLRTNGNTEIKWRPIENDMIYIHEVGLYYPASSNYLRYYDGKPAMIFLEWSLKPLIPEDHFAETVEEGALSYPQKVIIQAAKLAQIKPPGVRMSAKMGLLIVIAVVVGFYFLSQMF